MDESRMVVTIDKAISLVFVKNLKESMKSMLLLSFEKSLRLIWVRNQHFRLFLALGFHTLSIVLNTLQDSELQHSNGTYICVGGTSGDLV